MTNPKKIPTFSNRDISISKQDMAYQGFFKVQKLELTHKKFEGGETKPLIRELLDRGHAVAVLPYDPTADKVVLIEQFRIGAMETKSSAWLLEIIAGMVEPNESLEDVATRETMEEAGVEVKQLIPMLNYLSSPGGTTERIYLYLAIVDSSEVKEGVYGLAEEGEDIKVHTFSYNDMLSLLASGDLDNAATLIAAQWLQLNKTKIKKVAGKFEIN